MNYYEHHIGDYAEATGHLSFVEDAAYSRMIRKYYSTERPLPADIKAVQRLVVARTKEEQAAVQSVLEEFFVLKEDGWHQPRCDEELARLYAKSGKARASAMARWGARETQCERNANASVTHDERICEPDATDMRQPSKSQGERNALQSPVSSHQSPVSEGARKSRRPARRCPEDFEPDLDFARREVPGIDAEAEAAKFRDWEFAKARSDWAAAWRNWVRNARDRGSYARSPNGTGHPLPDTPEAPAILPNGQPNPIIVVGGRRVRQHIVGPEGQIGTNPEAVQW